MDATIIRLLWITSVQSLLIGMMLLNPDEMLFPLVAWWVLAGLFWYLWGRALRDN